MHIAIFYQLYHQAQRNFKALLAPHAAQERMQAGFLFPPPTGLKAILYLSCITHQSQNYSTVVWVDPL